uniref:Uncharacterized protein n=1 Tax=Glossina pallidipes TaxID=7398 RepID=A0A1A9ZLY8_GLOPL
MLDEDDPPNDSEEEEEDDSSSEETVEDSNESQRRRRRRRRLAELSEEGEKIAQNFSKNSRTIPGLPNLEDITKIAEILTTVGQQILPALVSGNSGPTKLLQNRGQLLQNAKNEIDMLAGKICKKSR